MSSLHMTLERSGSVSWRRRPAALVAVSAARLLAKMPPRRLRRVLGFACRGARPASGEQALGARDAVVAVSIACAGPRCLQRSIATALLCRMSGVWPQWCTGVVTEPFAAHAWVAVDGVPIGEDTEAVRNFSVVMSVP